MSKQKQSLTKEQIHGFSKPLLEEMVYKLLLQIDDMNDKFGELTEAINVMKSEKYGRNTEQLEALEKKIGSCFNEAEYTVDHAEASELEEPALEDINPPSVPEKKPRKKGPRDSMIEKLPHRDNPPVELNGEELSCECGGTFRHYDEDTSTHLEFHPASFEVVTDHIYKYKCDRCGKMRSAKTPPYLFEASLATPSLISGISTAKFVNAETFYRLEDTFASCNALITRQTMARWIIKTAESYMSQNYEKLKQELLSCSIIHADETTLEVSKDGRHAGSKSYMWVYTKEDSIKPVVIYEYQKTRNSAHPKEFLSDYKGWLCCDGYEGYHSLGKDITVCGCMVHARRHYCNAVKALSGKKERITEQTVSGEAIRRIADLFHTDNEWKEQGLGFEERLQLRQTVLKEKFDSYYAWVESMVGTVPPKSETGKGLQYSLNQKKYLLGALTNPDVPLDNSAAERSIRKFVINRKNFVLIDTLRGAEASAIMFSLAETARANKLKPYNWFEYLLTELPKHMEDNHKDTSYLDDLMPWSEKLPEGIRK